MFRAGPGVGQAILPAPDWATERPLPQRAADTIIYRTDFPDAHTLGCIVRCRGIDGLKNAEK